MKNKIKIPFFILLGVTLTIAAVLIYKFVVRPAISQMQYRKMAEANKVTSVSEPEAGPIEEYEEEPDPIEEEPAPAEEPVEEPEPQRILNPISDYDIPDIKPDFEELYNLNKDIYAWIYIPDTLIDYPVLQSDEELDYYLNRNLDGSTGYPGCIYSQNLNSKDFSDFDTVLYGHNMNAGTMFANLHYYEDKDFFDSHPYVYIFTEEGVLVYQVFAASKYPNILIPISYDFSSVNTRISYIEGLFEYAQDMCNIDTDVEIDELSNILTLSTCIPNVPENRYIVSTVLVADGRNYSEPVEEYSE